MQNTKAKLLIRNATMQDVRDIVALSHRVYQADLAYSESQVRGQINNFPEGVFVAEYEGEEYPATHVYRDGMKRVGVEDVLEKVLHSMSCRSSIMSGDELGQEDIRALLRQG